VELDTGDDAESEPVSDELRHGRDNGLLIMEVVDDQIRDDDVGHSRGAGVASHCSSLSRRLSASASL
jgi:hypothetical protein